MPYLFGGRHKDGGILIFLPCSHKAWGDGTEREKLGICWRISKFYLTCVLPGDDNKMKRCIEKVC